MRALVLADRDPDLDYAHVVEAHGCGVVLLLGDLTHAQVLGLADVEIPKMGVYGNHCVPGYLELVGGQDIHVRVVENAGLRFAGFGGCSRYKGGANRGPMFTQDEAAARLARLPPVDVLVCHSPPAGVHDDMGDPAHRGFDGLREYALRHRPAMLLHGHTYPNREGATQRTKLGSTEVVYVQGWAVVALPSPGIP